MAETRSETARYLPALPTVEEIQKDVSLFNSDHLPVISEIPVGDQTLRVISWNVQVPNTHSGFQAREKEKDIEAREERSLAALAAFINEQKPDVILLQETYFNPEKLRVTLAKLGWEVDAVPGTTTFTLYNTAKLEKQPLPSLKDEKKEGPPSYQATSIQQTLFKLKSDTAEVTDTSVLINNVHLPHDEYPHQAEAYILSLLRSGQAQYGNAIVAGDFNNRYVPLNKSYLPNNVVNPGHRDGETQGVDWTDGFFYMGKDAKCHQPIIMESLDPFNGKILPSLKIESLSEFLKKYSEKQKEELNKRRPMLCCAEEYRSLNKLNFDEKQNAELVQAGMSIGRVVNGFNVQKEVKHYFEKYTHLDHLNALDKCVSLLEVKDQNFVNVICEYMAGEYINSVRAHQATIKKGFEYKFENPFIQNILKESFERKESHGLSDKHIDALAKATILAGCKNFTAQATALQLATALMEKTPELSLECYRKIQISELDQHHQNLLVRRMIIAHIKTLHQNLQKQYSLAGGITNIFERKKLTKQMNELTKQLGLVSDSDQIQNYASWVLSIDSQPKEDKDIRSIKSTLRNNLEADLSKLGLIAKLENRPRT